MTKIVALDSNQHRNLKIKGDKTYAFTKSHNISPLLVHEIVDAGHDYPVVFIKDNNVNTFRLCAILGLKKEVNHCIDENGWKADYIPAAVRAYPFAVVKHPEDENQRVLCVDMDSEWVGEDEGEPLFDEKGEQTEFLKNIADFVLDLNQKQLVTEAFVQFLAENELLVERTLQITAPNGGKHVISGVHVVDEQKLVDLSDDKLLEMRKRGYLGPVYGSLMSLSRVNKLIKFATELGEDFTQNQEAQKV